MISIDKLGAADSSLRERSGSVAGFLTSSPGASATGWLLFREANTLLGICLVFKSVPVRSQASSLRVQAQVPPAGSSFARQIPFWVFASSSRAFRFGRRLPHFESRRKCHRLAPLSRGKYPSGYLPRLQERSGSVAGFLTSSPGASATGWLLFREANTLLGICLVFKSVPVRSQASSLRVQAQVPFGTCSAHKKTPRMRGCFGGGWTRTSVVRRRGIYRRTTILNQHQPHNTDSIKPVT